MAILGKESNRGNTLIQNKNKNEPRSEIDQDLSKTCRSSKHMTTRLKATASKTGFNSYDHNIQAALIRVVAASAAVFENVSISGKSQSLRPIYSNS
mmetsp:Transcript_38835/g.153502  ORF Transcript_38835/g.153502 Transcript_38835/m.153502 type:complete len:96 (-) Transcript_38835:2249-2536(-)